MRKFIPLAVAAALLGALSLAVVALAEPTGNFNQGQGQTCTYNGSNADENLQSTTIRCEGTISGLGNNPITVFVVIVANAGCSNPGNDDIPGQRRFTSPGFTPDQNGSVDYTVTGAINCHGNQLAFILSPVDLQAYVCTGNRGPVFKKGEQTNRNCTLIDTENNVPVT